MAPKKQLHLEVPPAVSSSDVASEAKEEVQSETSLPCTSSLLPTLSTDLVLEVLTRASLQSLEQCRSASDKINTFTNHSNFMNLFCQRTNTFSGYIVQSFYNRGPNHTFISCANPPMIVESLSLKFLPENVKIEALSNEGLAYCVSLGRRYYVCKPTTGEWVKLRNPKTRFTTKANAMVVLQTKPLHYVIVRLSNLPTQHLRDNTIFCEIFDSMTGFWKRAKDINFQKYVSLGDYPPVYTEGALHWFTNTGEIFTFNVNREMWKLIQLPAEVLSRDQNMTMYHEKKLVRYGGKLSLIDIEADKKDIWVMVNYTKRLWKKRGMVKIKKAIDLYTSDVVIVRGYHNLVVYNCQSHSFTSLDIGKILFYDEILPFMSDYELVF